MQAAALTKFASPRTTDRAIAAGLLVWGLPNVPWWWEHPGHARPVPEVLGALALTLAMSVPFCWRRRFPALVLAAAAAVLAMRMIWHLNEVSAFAAVLVGAYGLGAYSSASRRYARWLGWAALAAAVGTVLLSNGNRLAAVPFALLGAALVLGDAASARRSETVAAVEAAHQAERTRIARELHDVVAHQLSAIAVQAGTARLLASSNPDGQDRDHPQWGDRSGAGSSLGPAGAPGSDHAPGLDSGQAPDTAGPGGIGSPTEVLGTVERLARETLTELGHLLGALRREPADDLTRPPAPTLAELTALISTTKVAGTPAELTIDGTPRTLPAGVELSCYRIISEALTNVARHSPGAPAQVVLTYQPDRLDIKVVNAPPAWAHRPPSSLASSRGLGIRGMRERAELYGGQFEAGPRPDGGYLVAASIPCPGSAAGEASPAGPTEDGDD
jgi:signal transduction histidine kinase